MSTIVQTKVLEAHHLPTRLLVADWRELTERCEIGTDLREDVVVRVEVARGDRVCGAEPRIDVLHRSESTERREREMLLQLRKLRRRRGGYVQR